MDTNLLTILKISNVFVKALLTYVLIGSLSGYTPFGKQASDLFFQDGAPVIDGKFSEGEWKAAKQFALKDGGTVYITKIDDEAFVAFRGTQSGWAHVYVKKDDVVAILHASAALGESKYVKKDAQYTSTQKFTWDLRDRVVDEKAKLSMQKYYDSHGWVANNNNMTSENVIEYRINLKELSDGNQLLAFVFLSDSKAPHNFPLTLTDDTVNEQVLFGADVATVKFNSASWYRLHEK